MICIQHVLLTNSIKTDVVCERASTQVSHPSLSTPARGPYVPEERRVSLLYFGAVGRNRYLLVFAQPLHHVVVHQLLFWCHGCRVDRVLFEWVLVDVVQLVVVDKR